VANLKIGDSTLLTTDGVEVLFLPLKGHIDVYTSPKLKGKLIDYAGEGKFSIILDLKDVEFLDASPLGIMVGGLKRLKCHNGMLGIVGTHEKLLKIFQITGLIKVFPFWEIVDGVVTEGNASEGAFNSLLSSILQRAAVLKCVQKYANQD